MPEQDERQGLPRPQEQQEESLKEAQADQGASSISPAIIVPPVLIAIVMSLILAVVYGVTKEPIAEAKKADKRDKLAQVMPQFDNDPLELEQSLSETPPGEAGNVMLYTGTVPGGTSGYGITSAVGTGYSGYFSVVFGLDIEGSITSVKILETMETPGLGSKVGEPAFIDQFEGKSLGEFEFMVTKDGGDVDAVTGATITSRAVCEAVKQGLAAFDEHKPEPQSAPAEQAEPEVEVSESALSEAAEEVESQLTEFLDGEAEGEDG